MGENYNKKDNQPTNLQILMGSIVIGIFMVGLVAPWETKLGELYALARLNSVLFCVSIAQGATTFLLLGIDLI